MMSSTAEFRSRLKHLAEDAQANPADYDEGSRLLLSCGSRNIPLALDMAEAFDFEPRGVGRRHILIEIEDFVPDSEWADTAGSDIADYFEKIGGTNPQVSVDRNCQ